MDLVESTIREFNRRNCEFEKKECGEIPYKEGTLPCELKIEYTAKVGKPWALSSKICPEDTPTNIQLRGDFSEYTEAKDYMKKMSDQYFI